MEGERNVDAKCTPTSTPAGSAATDRAVCCGNWRSQENATPPSLEVLCGYSEDDEVEVVSGRPSGGGRAPPLLGACFLGVPDIHTRGQTSNTSTNTSARSETRAGRQVGRPREGVFLGLNRTR
jgi:hypothetical protein